MSDEDPQEPDPRAADSFYVSHFRQHLFQVQAHLSGNNGEPLSPLYVPPTGYWTSSEKDVFYHALCVFSRYRPDLIAASIKTKTVIDVCDLIDALDDAVTRDGRPFPVRSSFEGSMEVSNAWIRWEENRAARLVEQDEILGEDHEDEEVIMVPPSQVALVGDTRAMHSANQESWDTDKGLISSQEGLLKRLEPHHLEVMEGILREVEYRFADEIQPEDQECQRSGLSTHPLHPSRSMTLDSPLIHPSKITDEMVDPALLSLSSGPVHLKTLSYPADIKQTVKPQPGPQPALSSSLHSPNVPAVSPTFSSTPDVDLVISADKELETLPSGLSPTSRRRFQKRLYMRRKRAEMKGEETIAVVAKLRPGRKAKERLPKPRPKHYRKKTNGQEGLDTEAGGARMYTTTSVPHPESSPADHAKLPILEDKDEENEDGDSGREHPYHSKSGTTKPYRIRRLFAEKGIDANALVLGDLGLFHLSTLSRLMRLYKSGYDTASSTTASAISADTIRLMTAIVVDFASEAVHRAIVFREQEKKLKGDIKVWGRMRDEITTENVDQVLEMMGVKGSTRAGYFAELLGEDEREESDMQQDGDEKHSETDDDDGDDIHMEDRDDGGQDDDSEEDDFSVEGQGAEFPALLPLHRELNLPFIYLPRKLAPASVAHEDSEECLMPVATDEDELLRELEEEHELDEQDRIKSSRYEVDLRSKVSAWVQ